MHLGCYFTESGIGVFEEFLVAGTEIIQAGLATGGFYEAILGTLTVAGEHVLAIAAIVGQAFMLIGAELALLVRINHVDKLAVIVAEVSYFVFGINKVVAGIDASVSFYRDKRPAADTGQRTDACRQSHPLGHERFEPAYGYQAEAVLNPEVERAAEKLAPVVGIHRPIGNN